VARTGGLAGRIGAVGATNEPCGREHAMTDILVPTSSTHTHDAEDFTSSSYGGLHFFYVAWLVGGQEHAHILRVRSEKVTKIESKRH